MSADVADPNFDLWVVYDHPLDYPDLFVVRRYRGTQPTDELIVGPSLLSVRTQLRARRSDLIRFERAENDDPCVVEVYL